MSYETEVAALTVAVNTVSSLVTTLDTTTKSAYNVAVATAQTHAGTALTHANTAATQVGLSTTQASTATTQAGIATTKAGEASTSAATASAAATSATNSNNTATMQATSAANSAATATTQAGTATTQASLATTQAGIATAQATASAASALVADAILWVSGTTYAIGNARYSPTNGQTYRRLTAGAGTTDPASDTTNWVIVNGITSQAISILTNNLPAIRPSLDLDFANGQTVDPRITFTRASTATRTNSRGLIELVPSGVPRIDFDAVTGACKGLLIEEQRANLLTYSEQFDNAAWVKLATTITTNATTAPDGTLTADLVLVDASNGFHNVTQAVTGVVGLAYSISTYLKAGALTRYRLAGRLSANWAVFPAGVFDLTTGSIVSSTGDKAATIENAGGGWFRCTVYGTCATATNIGFDGGPVLTTTNNFDGAANPGGVYMWGAQLEAGAFPTSYIPTVASQVTRAADVASMTGVNFSSWYRSDEGSLLASYILSNVTTNSNIAGLSDGTTSNRMIIRGASNSTTASIGAVGGVTQWNDGFTSGSANTITQFSLAVKANDIAMTRNGVPVVTDTSASLPTVNQLRIGADGDGTGLINGHIRSLSYYPKRLTNLELQALSTQ